MILRFWLLFYKKVTKKRLRKTIVLQKKKLKFKINMKKAETNKLYVAFGYIFVLGLYIPHAKR